ncbi:MAG: reverse transcriptase domain-containing protein, partial [Chloroflexota bacterium]
MSQPQHRRRAYGQRARYRSRRVTRPGGYRPNPIKVSSGSSQEESSPKPSGAEANFLFDKFCNYENLFVAWRSLRKGRTLTSRRFTGSADRVSLELYERHLERNLTNLRYALRSGRYRSDPVRQFRLPKPSGGYRTLAVLTVKDRIAQRAALSVIEPLFEPEFLACSYAYRTERSPETALAQVEQYYAQGLRWVVDGDVEAFFDNIDRRRLLHLLEGRVKDRRVLALLAMWLDGTPVLPSTKPEFQREQVANPKKGDSILRPTVRVEEEVEEVEVELVEEQEAEALTQNRLSYLTHLFVESGLDWGISRLSGETSQPSYYSPPTSSPWAYRYRARGWGDDEDDELPNPVPGGKAGGAEDGLKKKVVRRLGEDGGLVGLMLARNLVKYSWKAGKLGLAFKAGAALGTTGVVGTLAYQGWKELRRRQLSQREPLPSVAGRDHELILPHFIPDNQRGIAQGSILSPFYSNVYLHQFDLTMSGQGQRLVRFADDLLLVCGSYREAEAALFEAEKALGELGLWFKPEKTRICPLEPGFKFLGAELGKNGRWILPEAGTSKRVETAEAALPGSATRKGWLNVAGWLKKTGRTKPGTV